ncbi:MAG: DUF962 domain-containing protein [Xanthomonadales bacterium]|nr:DUF962 domain-containing protein [Xanthomonadales bacterium]
MRKVDALLEEYGESHRNPVNKLIHWVAVPVIVWTVIALLWTIPFPFETGVEAAPVNWATLALLLAQVYWFRLSWRLGLGLLLVNVFLVQATVLLELSLAEPLWKVAVIAFVAAWILQFVGHMVEGKRPSFLRDVQFLLIGPAWLMGFIYRALGFRY